MHKPFKTKYKELEIIVGWRNVYHHYNKYYLKINGIDTDDLPRMYEDDFYFESWHFGADITVNGKKSYIYMPENHAVFY